MALKRPLLSSSASLEKTAKSSVPWKSRSALLAAENTIARWCELSPAVNNPGEVGDSRVTWDASKIQCCLSEEELKDQLLLRNIAHGAIISGRFWPVLIYDVTNPIFKHRTLSYLDSCKAMPTLSNEELAYFCIAVRDLWLANSRGLLTDQHEKNLLERLLDLLDEEILPGAEMRGLAFSFCPTKNRRVLKWAERLEELITEEAGAGMLDCIAQLLLPGAEKQVPLYAVWVDARDLSYHNFECMLPLDRALCTPLLPDGQHAPLLLTLTKLEPMHRTMAAFKCQLGGRDVDLVMQLDKLGLYQRPANYATRGGERFIFSSLMLSKAITEAVRASGLIDALQERLKSQPPLKPKHRSIAPPGLTFVMCNSVFRCNRFAAGDYKFEKHLDTPYYDAARHHVSKYTIIMYLSGGEGSPALRIDGDKAGETVSVSRLAAMQVVVFDQRYEHEGQAFESGSKVFVRSELIFEDKKVEHDAGVGALFSSAVYLSMESTFQPELARYAHEVYERVNRAHWGRRDDPLMSEASRDGNESRLSKEAPAAAGGVATSVSSCRGVAPTLLKRWRGSGLVFATNGHEYWFASDVGDNAKQASLLKLCALVATLDYFNASYDDYEPNQEEYAAETEFITATLRYENRKNFKRECKTRLLGEATADGAALAKKEEQLILPIVKEEKSAWFQAKLNEGKKNRCSSLYQPKKKKSDDDEDEGDEEDEEEGSGFTDLCCPDCCEEDGTKFDPAKCASVTDYYEDAVSWSRRKLLGAPLLILEKQLRFDGSNILIADDKIYLTSDAKDGAPLRINFASSWNNCWSTCEPSAYVGNETVALVPRFLLPPIPFVAVPATLGCGAGFRLQMDFFRNDWVLYSKSRMAHSIGREVPVPRYLSTPSYEDDGELLEAVLESDQEDRQYIHGS